MRGAGQGQVTAIALAKLGDESGIAFLKEALEDKEINLRAAEALAELGDKSGIVLLKEELESYRLEDSEDWIKILVRLDEKSIIPFLTKKLNETITELKQIKDDEERVVSETYGTYLMLIGSLYKLTK